MIIRKIRLTEYEYQPPINYVAGATEPDIQFQLADYTIPAGATARCYVQRFDGTFEYTVASIDGNNVTVEPTSSMFSVRGEGAIQITLYAGEEVLKTFSVPVYVHADLADENAEQGSDVTGIFRAAEEQALEDFQEAAEAKAAEVIESIPEDYTELTEEVSELNERLGEAPKIVDAEETEADLYICDANGNVIGKFVDGHIVTKNFDSRTAGTDMIMEADSDDADLYICDSFGNVIAEFKDGHIVTKNFDSADYADVLTDISAIQAFISTFQGIIYRNKEIEDGVYSSCNYRKRTGKQFCMLIAGDVHGDAPRMDNIVTYLNALECFDAGIMLGDIVSNDWRDDATYYTDALEDVNKPFLTVIGNHDSGSGDERTQEEAYTYIADLWAKFIEPNIGYADVSGSEYTSGNTYYYKDFADYKIRVIVLNQYDYPPDFVNGHFVYTRGALCYSQDQIDWFVAALNSVPSDYGVIIALHAFPCRMHCFLDSLWTSGTWTYEYNVPTGLMNRINGEIIEDIVDAWINGTALEQTYEYTVSGSWGTGVNVDADFTQRGEGEFITYIGGHWHNSILSETSRKYQKMYTVTTASFPASYDGNDQTRRLNAQSEDAFAVMSVDREKKTVKLFGIGAHFTNDGRDRLYGKYSYEIGGGDQ